ASGDKKDLELPAGQKRLMEAVLNTGKDVIVCVFAGSAMNLALADEKAAAVIQAWYPGSRGGRALANILFGEVSPSGKLPVTFYRDLEGLPDFEDYSMEGRTYRYLTKEPLYPFGYGLTYGDIRVEKITAAEAADPDQDLTLQITYKNYGSRATKDVLEVYIKNHDTELAPPNPVLCGFRKIEAQPGEEKTVELVIRTDAFRVVDEQGERILDSSSCTLYVGTSGPDERSQTLTGKKSVQLTLNWKHN
ncbi:MAG: glycoside hydrolase family 3 C-terminal domain-containing protein, partial [Lachnospiraceae bacterium]